EDLLLLQRRAPLPPWGGQARDGPDQWRNRAEPGEFPRVKLPPLGADRLCRRKVVAEHADVGAFAGRLCEQEVRHLDAAGTGHVLRHHRRMAGNVLADVAGPEPRPPGALAPRPPPDHAGDGLAPVEI